MCSEAGEPVPARRLTTPRRRALALGVVAVVVIGHLLQLAASAEHWPFSYYPMYRQVAQPILVLHGVDLEDEQGTVTPLLGETAVPNLDEQRLRVIVDRAIALDDVAPHRNDPTHHRTNALDAIGRAFAERLSDSEHAVARVHLVRRTWRVDDPGVDPAEPDEREVLLSVDRNTPVQRQAEPGVTR